MKINKTFCALVIGLATASVAQALPPGPLVPSPNPVFISGSTAFRTQVWNGLTDMGLAHQPGDASGNNIFTFTGTPNNIVLGGYEGGLDANLTSGPVTVYCSFDGSAQGVYECTHPAQQQNFEDVGAPSGGGVATFTHGSDIAFSDVEQASTAFPAPTLTEIVSQGAIATGTDQGIAVQPFLWAANSFAAAKITTINNYQAYNLFTSGQLGLSFWTGNPADYPTPVKLTGRDNTSGTRITAEQLTPYLTGDAIIQWTVDGGVGTPNTAGNTGPWALAPADGYGPNDSGYGSGGNVAKALGGLGVVADTSLVVGYVSFADAKGLVDAAAQTVPTLGTALIYNNINPILQLAGPFEYNIPAVENGPWPFWSYEHLLEGANVVHLGFIDADFGPGLVLAVNYEISLQVLGTPQTAILEENMNVFRLYDGGPINHF
jgi:hypothetical protein